MAHVMMRIRLPPTQVPFKFSGKAEGTTVNGPAADKAADAGNVELEKSSDTAQTAAMAVIGGAESNTGINVAGDGTTDLWKPVIDELQALGETVSQEDMSWIYRFLSQDL